MWDVLMKLTLALGALDLLIGLIGVTLSLVFLRRLKQWVRLVRSYYLLSRKFGPPAAGVAGSHVRKKGASPDGHAAMD
ncbi:MAG TPA: hypothetical protein VGT44_06375 [Ktedonobacteraceae bacterium]|nr:hypothetical protein [Ktedonobacteraceae bacterium]